ncbi:type II toxin-antitoxin system Phd/YefM family antitoxin [Jannaschia sp. LMIT008]|uniref:type II toxin-antitoxin system Phd/YefM family antitoxin n=1 Tax=Jannaschia maritima TaxID=3032585 RepID=UPI0028126621|nr:type II toxin-antitoxin system Phd/YefM family antitoxin [Jannaschia sp. LMIT008]
MQTITSRKFDQDASGAKRAAASGPVFITDRGRPAHVLLTIEAYHALAGRHRPEGATIVDMLSDPAAAGIPFEPEPVRVSPRDVDLG